MTSRQAVEYAPVELRLNPARPEEGRLLLGIIFAFNRDNSPEVGWRWRFDIPDVELEDLDSLSREIFVNRKETLKKELLAAMKVSAGPREVLSCLSARNIWSIHIGKPISTKVNRVNPGSMAVEDWVDSWSSWFFDDDGATWLERPHLLKQVNQAAVRVPVPA